MHLSIIIPCFNEAENVADLATQIAEITPTLRQRGPFELLFINDGSTDATAQVLANAFADMPEARIIDHQQNRGLGAALRTGLQHARGEIIVTTDSDGTYPFTSIPAMLDRLTPDIDIVTASPYHPDGNVEGVPVYRLIFSKGASALYRLLLDPRLHTYTSMYRAYRRPAIAGIVTTSDGFLMVTELLVQAMLAGARVAEFPTTLRVRRYGQSKARVWQITRSHLAFQRYVLWQRLQHPFSAVRRSLH